MDAEDAAKTPRKAAALKASATKGEAERSRAASKANWTRTHGKDDARNPFTRVNETPGDAAANLSAPMLSSRLFVGEVYSRKAIGDMLGVSGGAMAMDVFRRKGTASVLLFVTEQNAASTTQYADHLEGDTLF